MRVTFSVEPQKEVMVNIPVERRMTVKYQNFDEFSATYIGSYSYCWNLSVDNGLEFTPPNVGLIHNVLIGNSNSIANGLECVLEKNYSTKSVSLGAWILGMRDENIHCSIIENH